MKKTLTRKIIFKQKTDYFNLILDCFFIVASLVSVGLLIYSGITHDISVQGWLIYGLICVGIIALFTYYIGIRSVRKILEDRKATMSDDLVIIEGVVKEMFSLEGNPDAEGRDAVLVFEEGSNLKNDKLFVYGSTMMKTEVGDHYYLAFKSIHHKEPIGYYRVDEWDLAEELKDRVRIL